MAQVLTGLDSVTTVEVTLKRYEQLVQAEQKLSMLELALSKKENYSNIDDLKEIFNLKKGN
jgi:hypothetical protein